MRPWTVCLSGQRPKRIARVSYWPTRSHAKCKGIVRSSWYVPLSVFHLYISPLTLIRSPLFIFPVLGRTSSFFPADRYIARLRHDPFGTARTIQRRIGARPLDRFGHSHLCALDSQSEHMASSSERSCAPVCQRSLFGRYGALSSFFPFAQAL